TTAINLKSEPSHAPLKPRRARRERSSVGPGDQSHGPRGPRGVVHPNWRGSIHDEILKANLCDTPEDRKEAAENFDGGRPALATFSLQNDAQSPPFSGGNVWGYAEIIRLLSTSK